MDLLYDNDQLFVCMFVCFSFFAFLLNGNMFGYNRACERIFQVLAPTISIQLPWVPSLIFTCKCRRFKFIRMIAKTNLPFFLKLMSTCFLFHPFQCFFPENLIANIKTPLFILNAAYDSWQVTLHFSIVNAFGQLEKFYRISFVLDMVYVLEWQTW